MKKKVLAMTMATAMVAGLLAGCGGSSAPASAPAGEAADTTTEAPAPVENDNASGTASEEAATLRVALWDYSNSEYYKTIFDAFHEEHPTIDIEVVEFASDEYNTVLQTQLAGKQNFDVVFNKELPVLSLLINQGHLLPIDDYIANDPDFNAAAYSGLIEQLGLDGKSYGLPFRKDNNMIFYNKDLFDAAGVDYPQDGMTMEEYAELAAKMTSGTGNDKVYGAHVHTWVTNATQYARRVGEFNQLDPDTYEAMLPYYKTILGMQDAGYVQDYGALKSSNIHYSGVFYNEQAAMLQMGTWFINMLCENTTFNWGVCSLPNDKGEGNTSAVGGVTPVSIGAYAEHPDQAWTFIKYVTGEEGAKVLAGTGILPGYNSPAISEIFDKLPETYPGAPEGLSKYIDLDTYVIEFPMDAHGKEIDTIWSEEHSAIMTETITPEEGIQNLIERVSAIQ